MLPLREKSVHLKRMFICLPQGPVKKCGLLKIVHDRFRAVGGARQKASREAQEFRLSLQEAAEQNRELAAHIAKAQETLNPLRVLHLFRSIPEEVGGG